MINSIIKYHFEKSIGLSPLEGGIKKGLLNRKSITDKTKPLVLPLRKGAKLDSITDSIQ